MEGFERQIGEEINEMQDGMRQANSKIETLENRIKQNEIENSNLFIKIVKQKASYRAYKREYENLLKDYEQNPVKLQVEA